MVMLRMWSVLWRENGHFTEVLTLMDICIFYCILWSVVFCFLYTVYLTFKSPHLLLPFHQCFPPHCRFLHTGEREDFMPAKIEQVFQNREGE